MLPWLVKFALQFGLIRELTPLLSADPRFPRFSRKSGIVTPLESALTDTPSAKFFRIRTYEKYGGRGTYSPLITRCSPTETAWETGLGWQRWLRVRGSGGGADLALEPWWI